MAAVGFGVVTLLITLALAGALGVIIKNPGDLGLFRWLWLKPGLYRRMIGDYLAFYKPDFHPWQVDDRDLIADAEAGLAQPA